MGDHVELQITPETPGRSSIRNPFESPNDYHHLREALVPSPSVFKSKPCKATPPKFNWSIDEMASLLPVHIDPEEIQRQSFYLSQTRTDSDIEEKRQNAIEQFFTKGAIVPSPWAAPDSRKGPQNYTKSCVSAMIAEEPEKNSVACQTTLSLPLAFDLEKMLGEYYRHEEACDAVQESLSSSSLRRKLFLDGQASYSGSDSSSPPSPERSHTKQERPSLNQREGAEGGVDAISSIFSSPLSCGVSVQTPSTGQFSSSPIQHGRFRDCSLGSIASPLFPDRSSPAGLISPTISPIVAHIARTPIGSAERKQPSNVTPHSGPLHMEVPPSNESPFVEGCSPIRSCSPHQVYCHSEHQHNARPKPRPRVRCWASPPLISPILNPKLQDNLEAEEPLRSSSSSSSSSSLPPMELDPSSPMAHNAHPADTERVSLDQIEPVKMEEDKETGIEGRLEDEEDEEAEDRGPSGQLTSSRMGNVSATESSQMFISLLAEGSSIRYESSMQVDSGYNTTSAGTASLIDGLSSDCHSKESFSSNMADEAFQATRHTKVKVFYHHH